MTQIVTNTGTVAPASSPSQVVVEVLKISKFGGNVEVKVAGETIPRKLYKGDHLVITNPEGK